MSNTLFFNLTKEDENSLAKDSIVFTVEKDGTQRITSLGNGFNIILPKDFLNVDNLTRLVNKLKELKE